MIVRPDEQHQHDQRDSDDVPPHADVAEQSHQFHAEGIEQSVNHQHDQEDMQEPRRQFLDDRVANGIVAVEVDEPHHILRQRIVNGSDDTDLANEVKPSGEPTPQCARSS